MFVPSTMQDSVGIKTGADIVGGEDIIKKVPVVNSINTTQFALPYYGRKQNDMSSFEKLTQFSCSYM